MASRWLISPHILIRSWVMDGVVHDCAFAGNVRLHRPDWPVLTLVQHARGRVRSGAIAHEVTPRSFVLAPNGFPYQGRDHSRRGRVLIVQWDPRWAGGSLPDAQVDGHLAGVE